jgi:hypothetical protein
VEIIRLKIKSLLDDDKKIIFKKLRNEQNGMENQCNLLLLLLLNFQSIENICIEIQIEIIVIIEATQKA